MTSVREIDLKVVEKNRFSKFVRDCMRAFLSQSIPSFQGCIKSLLLRIFDHIKTPALKIMSLRRTVTSSSISNKWKILITLEA